MITLLSHRAVWTANGGPEELFPPWHFAICACGTDYLVRPERVPELMACPGSQIAIPSLHIIGKRDPIVDQSRALVTHYADPVVIERDMGHEINMFQAADTAFIKDVERFVKTQHSKIP